MRQFIRQLKASFRPVQRNVLFPVRHFFRLRAWEKSRSAPVILTYHGVEHEVIDPMMQPFVLTSSQFRATLEVLLENHEVVTMDRLLSALDSGEPLSPRWAVLTFDDGYVNNLNVVRPILREFGDLPATIYVCPGKIEHRRWLPDTSTRLAILHSPARELRLETLGITLELGPRRNRPAVYTELMMRLCRARFPIRYEVAKEALASLPPDLYQELRARFHSEELLTWEQLEQLASEPNITIGAHTVSHVLLHENQPEEVISYEIGHCRRWLEERLSRPVLHFAYPGGMYCPAACKAVIAAGYRTAVTIEPGEVTRNCDRFLLPRLHSSPYSIVMKRTLACAATNGRQGWWF